MLTALCACLLGASVAPVPVMPKPKPKFEIVLRVDDKKSPLDGEFAKVEVRNEFFSSSISSPFSFKPRPVGTVPAGKSLAIRAWVFHAVDTADLVPGKYKCRVRFKYDNVDVLSEWVTVELTEKHLADK